MPPTVPAFPRSTANAGETHIPITATNALGTAEEFSQQAADLANVARNNEPSADSFIQ